MATAVTSIVPPAFAAPTLGGETTMPSKAMSMDGATCNLAADAPTAPPARRGAKRTRKDDEGTATMTGTAMTTAPAAPMATDEAKPKAKRMARAKAPANVGTGETTMPPTVVSEPSAMGTEGGAEEHATTRAEAGGTGWLIVAKSVRSLLKAMPDAVHCGADALPAINTKLQCLLVEAAARAHENGRKTLKASDL